MKRNKIVRNMKMFINTGQSFSKFKKMATTSPDSNYGKHVPARKLKAMWYGAIIELIWEKPFG